VPQLPLSLANEYALAVLELNCSGFFFHLKWRIFKNLGAAVSFASFPSGAVISDELDDRILANSPVMFSRKKN
jgi:hypothetical protein